MTPNVPPSLAAVLEPQRYRDERIKICLTPSELQQLKAFAQQADVPVARLCRALVLGGLERLADDAAAQLLEQVAA